MSLGSAGRPSTTTIDPTPPALRPIQQQLAAMMSARLSGQGRASVPTYGQTLPNIQQQLYGVNPRPAVTPPGLGGGGGIISPPDKPQFGGWSHGWGATPDPRPTLPPLQPTGGGDLVPFANDTIPETLQPFSPVAPNIPFNPTPESLTPTGIPSTRPLPFSPEGMLQSTAQPESMSPGTISPPRPTPMQMPLYGDSSILNMLARLTRGGPMGAPQGGSYVGPGMQLPRYGDLSSGSRMMYSMNSPYGRMI
jgi:hypothetical protein